jgi:hypothetical protein
MIRWLEDNPVGIVLASICGGLVVVSMLLAVIWTLPASAPSTGPDDEFNLAALDLPELAAVDSLQKYAEITNRPVFNESRLPVLETNEDEDTEEEVEQEDVDAPDVELVGVVITPSLRMATLKEKGEKLSLVAFEGMPLEGNYGTWQISRVEPREITLSSGNGEELQLPLLVHDRQIAQPPKPQEPPGEKSEDGNRELAMQEEDEPLTRAEEIRQRIAERREELRRAAEAGEELKPATKREVIQAMMQPKRQEKSENDENK